MSGPILDRRAVVAALLAERAGAPAVLGLGACVWDAAAAGDDPLNFGLWGAMGGAVPIGLGLALAQPARRVLVITGDGEMLMGLGSLATVAAQAPSNLAIAVIDNERYGETGMQRTHTAFGVDLAGVAAAAGFAAARRIDDDAGLAAALSSWYGAPGPVFLNIKVAADPLPLVLPPRDGVHLKTRFRRALLSEA